MRPVEPVPARSVSVQPEPVDVSVTVPEGADDLVALAAALNVPGLPAVYFDRREAYAWLAIS